MRARFSCLWVLFLFALPLFSQTSGNLPVLRVEEQKIRYSGEPPYTLQLPLVSGARQAFSARVHLELLFQDDKSLGSLDHEASIVPGHNTLSIPWRIKFPSDSVSSVYWWRLRYSIAAVNGSAICEGIVQLAQIIPDLFGIQVSSLRYPNPGSSFPLRVRIDQPKTGKSLSGVRVQVQPSLNDEEKLLPAQHARTDGHGMAIFNLKIPADATDSLSIEITAQNGSWQDSKSIELDLKQRARVNLSTDKPIYQPGQVLHIRALIFGPDNHALANATVKFSIEDEDRDDEFQAEVKTSEFGVAQTEWEIPEKVELGDYRIKAELDDDVGTGYSQVRISRYELPQFTVVPSIDKTFYLPGGHPQLEVKADYLFGQPVKHGTVRIVRDNGRNWNREKKEYDIDEDEVEHGELDSGGKFTTTLNVEEDFDELRKSDYRRFEDLRYAAYVTDLSTNRTEQKHFYVRISKDPIHVYLISRDQRTQFPPDYYVMTSLPDGRPASADVIVSVLKPEAKGGFPADPQATASLEVAHLHTNKYGVGHFRARTVPKEFIDTRYYKEIRLLVEASDRRIGRGIHTEDVWAGHEGYLRILPVATLLRQSEDVTADIESSLPDQEIFVDLIAAEGILASQAVELKHGRAHVEFAYDDKFRGHLSLLAHALQVNDYDRGFADTAEVLFPGPQDLELGVHLAQTTYKPGEPASARFNVRSPDGQPAKSALGVVIYDKAVAERVSSDQEFGHYGFYLGEYYWSDYPTIAGVSYHDLLNRKLTGPVPPDLELLAEAIMASGYSQADFLVDGDEIGTPAYVFRDLVRRNLSAVQDALVFSPTKLDGHYPQTLEQLRTLLAQHGTDFDKLRDPWGMPYRARFSTIGAANQVEILSNGPDKLPDTEDDFAALTSSWQYFAPIGHAIDSVTGHYARETGRYIQDFATLAGELRARTGIELQTLNDPWGHPYSFKFDIDQATYQIRVYSAGPDGIFESPEKASSDDVLEWTSITHYFQRETTAIDSALAQHFRQTKKFPTNEEEFQPVLRASGLSPQTMLDPWGNPYHFVFSQSSRYSDHIDISDYSVYGGESQRTTNVTPVTQQVGHIRVVSYGANKDPGNQFTVAEFNRVLTEQSSKDLAAQQTSSEQVPSTGGTGAISGSVVDPQGAVIAGAKVTATDKYTNQQFSTTSDSSGMYLLRNLPAGLYKVEVEAQGFRATLVDAVPVSSSNLTKVDVKLAIGAASETVEVAAAAPTTTNTEMALSTTVRGVGSARIQAEKQAFTPRVRKYFPETLLWQPELVTDSSGKAQLKFAMADNITTWKMSVIASTASGQLAVAEKELRTFQPFFIDHEPPKILTQGDQIQLPVVLRNYLKKAQQVDVKLEQSPWFSLQSAPQQRIEVAAGEDAIAKFSITADHAIREGKERVTAANRETGDAIERSVSVHPDGEDISQTVAALIAGDRNTLTMDIPINAIRGSIDAELKIYPNVGAHVLDSLNALVARPAGCAEQITSIAFSSVVVLQLLHKAGQDNPETPDNPNADLERRARKYVSEAYQKLMTLQASDGGFPYWVDNKPNLAVTAHVLDFLGQASEFIKVDGASLKQARHFLASNQNADGSWSIRWYNDAPYVDVNLSALITRVLAESGAKMPDDAKAADTQGVLSKAMKFLEGRAAEWNDPYVVGQYAMAAAMSGRPEYADRAHTLLRKLAHEEGPGTYWNLEANTSPFYSWGQAGRAETTGIVVRALAHFAPNQENPNDSQLLDRGLTYLLHHKDVYGSWYSTQATINVIRGIVDALPQIGEFSHPAGTAELEVNGKPAATLQLPSSARLSGPITADISPLLAPGANHIRVSRLNSSAPLDAQIISTHYIPWGDSQATKTVAFKAGESRALRLNVSFDHTEAQMGKAIQCMVDAERIGFAGYGMMLAEIGLPPGAEVDRESLQKALAESNIYEYDVLPDRVIFYLWPQAGGSKFSFSFKPRFAMNASAAPSILYDYYNPDARATVAPAKFVVH